MRALIVRRIKSLIAGAFAVLFLGTLTGAAQAAFTVTVENSNPTGGVVTSSTGLIDCGTSCSDSTFQNNTNVTLTADPAFGFIFSGWTNITCSPTTPACTPPSCDNATGVCEIIKGANNKTYFVTANFTAVPIDGVCGSSDGGTFTIAPDTNLCSAGSATAVMGSGPWSWNCTGANGGTTANCSANIRTYTATPSAGLNGNISPSTPVTVNHGLTTQFTVTADEGYTASAGGTCGGTLVGNTYTTNAVTADCTVMASFTPNQHTLTLNTAGLGSGSAGGGGTYAYGTVNQVTATADSGSTFTGWSGDCSGTDSPYILTMLDRAMTCTATFTLNTYTVTFQTDGNGTIDGTTPQTIDHGGSATAVTANANSGYQFVNWTGTGGFVTTTSNPLAVSNVTADMTITANFTNSPVDGVCGADDGQTLTAAPTLLCSAGDAAEVTGDGHPWNWDCTGANGGTTANCTAEIQTYTIEASAGANGNITPDTAQTVDHGSAAEFTVTANEGYTASAGGTCGGSLIGNTYTTNAVTADCTVVASFTADPIDGACGSSNGGTFTSEPLTGLCFAGTPSSISGGGPWNWSCTGANGGTTASCSAEIQTYTVTPSSGSNGSISPSTPVTVSHGLTTQFTVTADEGYTAVVGGTCGGTLVGSTYTTGLTTADCTVSATFAIVSTTPDPFIFTHQTGIALNTIVTSDEITVSGINASVAISVSDGEYSINNGAFTTSIGTITNGSTVRVRQTSSGSYSTTTVTTLTIGGVSGTFSVTTINSQTPPSGGPVPVGYSPLWVMITFVSLVLFGFNLLRRRLLN
jgi:uncharacterized repeat protein (TIGR02543 family)